MAGGKVIQRQLGRDSAHRQALLRNLVTSLIEHETIQTTWHKAKEAQRLAEKVITLGKKNTNASRLRAEQILFTPVKHMGKLFGELRERYIARGGGYTRVLRIEPINRHHDQAPSAILELVDGPKDMRFAMTAKTLVRERAAAKEDPTKGVRETTALNIKKVTRYRPGGQDALLREIERLEYEEAKKLESVDVKRRDFAADKAKRTEEFERSKGEYDAKTPRERRLYQKPEKPDDELDEEDLVVRPQREGWESYPLYRKRQRSRIRDKKENERRDKE